MNTALAKCKGALIYIKSIESSNTNQHETAFLECGKGIELEGHRYNTYYYDDIGILDGTHIDDPGQVFIQTFNWKLFLQDKINKLLRL